MTPRKPVRFYYPAKVGLKVNGLGLKDRKPVCGVLAVVSEQVE